MPIPIIHAREQLITRQIMEGDKIIKTLKSYSSSKPVDLGRTHSAIKVSSCLAEDTIVNIICSVSYRLY